MQARPKYLRSKFESFKKGNAEELASLLESERSRLYDYVLRMTGQVNRASETAYETMAAVGSVADDSDTLDELLTTLYKTSRNFAIDIWNADTSRLQNDAYQRPNMGDGANLTRLDKVLRMQPPVQREVLLLRLRLGFDVDEVAEIMGISSSDGEQSFAQGLSALEEELSDLKARVPAMLAALPHFAEPEPEEQQTKNLSLIIHDFKKSSRNGLSLGKIIKILAIAGVVGAGWVYWPEIRPLLPFP